MVRRWLVLAAVAGIACTAAPAEAQRAVFLVRHAERLDDSRDSPLSAVGEERARLLARTLAGAGVTTIYTTEFRRTRQTAAPLAAALGLAPVVVSGTTAASTVEETMRRIRAHGPEDVILVVGHSNTVPMLLQALGHADSVSIADDQYGDLFVVVPVGEGSPVVLRIGF